MYIASAISIIMRNVQAKNGIHTELNGAGLLFNELRGEATPTSGRQAGSLGSVSWWIKDVTYQNLTPYELVEQILTNFWSYLDIPLDFSVYDKFKAFIALSDLDEIDFTKLETLLIYLLNTIDNNFINITKQLRQNLLTKNDLNDLRSRIFLHEIPVSLPELLTEIDNIISAGNLSQQYNYVPSDINIFKWNKYWQSTLPGGGFLLVIFALYAECAFTIASIINGLSEEEQLGLYQDYAKAGDTESRTEIVRHLVWSLDLVNLLAKYSSIVEAKGWLNDIEEELGIYNINLGIISQRITL
jgi:hypothetical protein